MILQQERAGRLDVSLFRKGKKLVGTRRFVLPAHRIRYPNIRSVFFANHVPSALAVQHTLHQLCRRIGHGSVLLQADQRFCNQTVIQLRLRLLSWQSSAVIVPSRGCKEDPFDTLLR